MTVNCWYGIQGKLQGNPSLYLLRANDTAEATEERNERLTEDLKAKTNKKNGYYETTKPKNVNKNKCMRQNVYLTQF